MTKPHLIFLCHRIPYPPDKGDKIRSWQLFKHLCRSWSVHLATFIDDPADRAYRSVLSDMAASSCFIDLSPRRARIKSALGFLRNEPLSFAYYRSGQLTAYLSETMQRFPVAASVGFSSAMAPHLMALNAPIVMDCCDSDAEKWRAYAENKSGLGKFIFSREARLLARAETNITNQTHATFAITKAEARLFNERDGVTGTVHYWENGVDTHFFDPGAEFSGERPAQDQIVMVGAMDYAPNADAALWFIDNVWPKLRAENPALKFFVVGSKPIAALRDLDGQDGIHVTGRVDDVRPYLAGAGVVVAPLQIARGIQNKVLEGMAMAKPVIASSGAATGVRAEAGRDLMIVDKADDYVSAIKTLLTDRGLANEIGAAARARVLNEYSWAANLKEVDQALAPLRARS